MPSVLKTDSCLVASTFFTPQNYYVELIAGLPCEENFIKGQSQILRSFDHPNLCKLLETIRGKHGRTVVVSEFRGSPLSELSRKLTRDDILKIFYQITSGKP